MRGPIRIGCSCFALSAITALALWAQFRGGQGQPEFVRQGQQLIRQGKPDEALALYRRELETSPDSLPAHNAAGVVLDLMGRGEEARKHFAKAIEAAPSPQARASAQRAMAMSWAFEGDCANTVKFERQVFDYYASVKDFYQQGEMADEAARVCIEAGDLDTAYEWYRTGHETGLKEPGIQKDRVDLWNFRWEHAQARIAARRKDQAGARTHMAAAKGILDGNPEVARTQAVFYPYLAGYVALYGGDYKTALEQLLQAGANDPFIQCLIGQAYEQLGDKEKAAEYYRKASATTGHNPPAAYAHFFTRKKAASR